MWASVGWNYRFHGTQHQNIIIETGFCELIIQVATAFEWAIITVGGIAVVEGMDEDSCPLVKA